MSKSILTIENLHVQIGKRMILRNISLEINPGEVVGIIGPNGCGKTTLLNTVSGFLPVDTGIISFAGQDIMGTSAHMRARLGIARGFQHSGIFKEMTVEENIAMAIERTEAYPWWWMFSKRLKDKMSASVALILDEVNLLPHRKSLAGVLSGGEARLLELARLKATPAKLLLLDEPTAGVSPVLRNNLSSMIKKLAADDGRSIVVVEHDMRFLFGLADRIIVLVDGQKYLEGTSDEVQNDSRLQEIYLGK